MIDSQKTSLNNSNIFSLAFRTSIIFSLARANMPACRLSQDVDVVVGGLVKADVSAGLLQDADARAEGDAEFVWGQRGGVS